MAAIEFVQNYDDLSTDQGFQFKFFCDRCGNGFMSTFEANRLGMAGGFLRAVGGVLGGALGNAADSTYEIQRAVGGSQHDKALREAVTEIKPLFYQCKRCGQWVCQEVCWNRERSLCKICAPVLSEELASAQAAAAKDQIYDKVRASDQTEGIDASVKSSSECPGCGAAVAGGKFCPECGAPMAREIHCTECGAKVPAGSKFCRECGHKV